MHPAPVCSDAMVPDLHVPQMSLAFGEPTACQRGAADQTVLEPANDCWARLRPDTSSGVPLQTSLYPGRPAVCAAPPCQPCPPCPVPPLRSNRVSSSSDVKDLSQPLFVDTTVEYDLPKAAYPPENSEPLLIVHPQYYEHLRHRRTLGAGCSCQLCNFYGRRIPHGGQGEAAAAAAAAGAAGAAAASATATVTCSAAPAVSVSCAAAAAVTGGHQQTFQKPEAPRPHWPRHFPQPQHQHHLLQQHQAAQQRQLAAQQQQQQQVHQLTQQQVQQVQPVPRYNCMLDQRREAAAAGLSCTAAVQGAAGQFVTPTVSCDSDSGYSSVELEPPEWCQRPGRHQQPQRAECDVRDVLAKRKRRVDVLQTAADHAAASAAKRLRINYWPGGVPALDMVPYLHRQPAVM